MRETFYSWLFVHLWIFHFIVHPLVSAAARDRSAPQQISNANQDIHAPTPYVPFTCAQARLVGRTLFSDALHKYGVHRLHSTFLVPWGTKDEEEEEEMQWLRIELWTLHIQNKSNKALG